MSLENWLYPGLRRLSIITRAAKRGGAIIPAKPPDDRMCVALLVVTAIEFFLFPEQTGESGNLRPIHVK